MTSSFPSPAPKNDRHSRVVSLIRELAASYIRQESNADPLITVTNVTTSPDYRRVTIYFTTIPEGREDVALGFLKRSGGDMRGFIKKHSNLKIIPFLEFSIDYGERHRQQIDTIAAQINEQKTK